MKNKKKLEHGGREIEYLELRNDKYIRHAYLISSNNSGYKFPGVDAVKPGENDDLEGAYKKVSEIGGHSVILERNWGNGGKEPSRVFTDGEVESILLDNKISYGVPALKYRRNYYISKNAGNESLDAAIAKWKKIPMQCFEGALKDAKTLRQLGYHHLDVKKENMLLKFGKNLRWEIRIIDWDTLSSPEKYVTGAGTPEYMNVNLYKQRNRGCATEASLCTEDDFGWALTLLLADGVHLPDEQPSGRWFRSSDLSALPDVCEFVKNNVKKDYRNHFLALVRDPFAYSQLPEEQRPSMFDMITFAPQNRNYV